MAVTAVANGLQAWKILEDITNHIDLVLAELSMPHLSGIGLLAKIKNHKICKNIPVISEYHPICCPTLFHRPYVLCNLTNWYLLHMMIVACSDVS